MEDREFLLLMVARLIKVYGEDPSTDFVTKLLSIAQATPRFKVTPNTATYRKEEQ